MGVCIFTPVEVFSSKKIYLTQVIEFLFRLFGYIKEMS